jgi:hypothetical protein
VILGEVLENSFTAGLKTSSFRYFIAMNAGDNIELWAHIDSSGASPVALEIHNNSTIKITPTFIYFTAGRSLLPNWTKLQFINNILGLFCGICDFETKSKTLTIDLFEGIKNKEPISLDIAVNDIDFSDFIGDFFKSNILSYQDADTDFARRYNLTQDIKYGAGEILVDNSFIDKQGPLSNSDLKAPTSYVNTSFSMSMERVAFVSVESNGESEFTSVTDNAGLAQINVPDPSIFDVLELVRIENSTANSYNGDRQIIAKGANFIILQALTFSANAIGKITKLNHQIGSDDGVYVFINIPSKATTFFSRNNELLIMLNTYASAACCFFNLLDQGLDINSAYKQSLSFGEIVDPLFYQRTLIQVYWQQVKRVLNDPVKLLGEGYIPHQKYLSLSFLRPIEIKTIETSNLYYLNLLRGYKGSEYSCDVELIKLS